MILNPFRIQMRRLAVQLLDGLVSPTGETVRIEANRAADVTDQDTPFLGVYIGHENKMQEQEATDALFLATMTLHVDVRTGQADLEACEFETDWLITAAQEVLLSNPLFYLPQPKGGRLVKLVRRIDVQSTIKQTAEINYGMALIAFDIEYGDAYPTVIPDVLKTVAITVSPNLVQTPPVCPPDLTTVTVTLTAPPVT